MTEPWTPERAAALRRLCEQATPGPWEWFYEDESMPAILGNKDYAAGGHVLTGAVCASCEKTGNRCLCPNEADAAFIAATRTALPDALDALAAKDAALADAQREMAELRRDLDLRTQERDGAMRATQRQFDALAAHRQQAHGTQQRASREEEEP